jgi:hypothetical protein
MLRELKRLNPKSRIKEGTDNELQIAEDEDCI